MKSNPINMMAVLFPVLCKNDYEYIQSIRKTSDPRGYSYMEPHITIISPVDGISRNNFINKIEKNLSCFCSFEFELNTGVSVPPQGSHKSWYSFLLPDKGSKEFINLHNLVNGEIIGRSIDKLSYIPHLTIGSFDEDKPSQDLARAYNQRNKSISGVIDRISIIELQEEKAHVVKEFKFFSQNHIGESHGTIEISK